MGYLDIGSGVANSLCLIFQGWSSLQSSTTREKRREDLKSSCFRVGSGKKREIKLLTRALQRMTSA